MPFLAVDTHNSQSNIIKRKKVNKNAVVQIIQRINVTN